MKKLKKVFALGTLALCAASITCLSACSTAWFGDNLGGGGSYSGTPTSEISGTNAEAIEGVASTVAYDTTTSTSAVPSGAVELNDSVLSGSSYKLSTKDATYSFTGTQTISSKIKIQKSCTIYLNAATLNFAVEKDDLFKVTKDVSVTFVIVDGTENVISVTGTSSRAINLRGDEDEDGNSSTETDGCTLSIIGSGKLTISSTDDCIKSRGNLIVKDATLVLTSTSGCALKGNTIALNSCSITANTAGKDAIHAEIDEWDSLATGASAPTFSSASDLYEFGYVICQDSTLNLTTTGEKGDGIQADSFVYVTGGTLSIDIGDDAKGIKVGLDYTFVDNSTTTDVDESEESYDLDCDYYAIYITGGTFTINSVDDAIHSEAEIYITGGTFNIASGDDAIHAENLVQISGDSTSITISSCYEGIEATHVEIAGGTIDLTSSDDGINAAGGKDCYILIKGGTISVSALGDGVDSNGDIFIYGGSLFVNGPASGDNEALDADGSIMVYGGQIFAVGPKQTVQTPSIDSEQCVISYASNSNISANTTLSLKDSSGTTIISLTIARACQSIVISHPDLVQGQTYYLYSGSTKLGSITLSTSSYVTSIGSNGQDYTSELPGFQTNNPGMGR